MKQFIKTNFLLIVILANYFYILFAMFISANNIGGLILILTVQALLTIFLLSSAGENFIRQAIYNGRELLFESERNYLNPLFREVYKEALKHNPNLSRDIELYIIDSLEIQAYALGKNTIMITQGAVNILKEEDLKGILAHEFGHISNHFTKVLIFLQTSIWVATAAMWLYKVIARVIKYILKTKENDYGSGTIKFISFIIDSVFVIPIATVQFIIAVGRRTNELYADDFAAEIGYGEGLRNALILIHNLDLAKSRSFLERLMDTHPPTPERISRLETA